jgi:hypothetical protein
MGFEVLDRYERGWLGRFQFLTIFREFSDISSEFRIFTKVLGIELQFVVLFG